LKISTPRLYAAGVRSYSQLCALAKALDVVGDRWTMLVIRELLLRGPSRYTDVRDGLPGIASNLLAGRLRELERAGLVARDEAPPPVATTLYRLTPRGEELEAVIAALVRWGVPLVVDADPDDAFRSHWLTFPVEALLTDRAPDRPPVTLEVRAGDEPVVVETAGGGARVRRGGGGPPDALLAGPPKLVLGVLTAKLALDDARARGVTYEGDPAVLRRLLPA
jgi:DNA-binding HxlR family transcriptional regulator